MSLFKNILLSAYSLIHLQSAYSCASGLSTWAEMVGLPKDSVSDQDESSPRQNHMLGSLKGFNLAMLYLCGMGLLRGDSGELRDQMLVAEGLLYAITGYDAIQLGVTKFLAAYLVPSILSGIAVFGPSIVAKIKASK